MRLEIITFSRVRRMQFPKEDRKLKLMGDWDRKDRGRKKQVRWRLEHSQNNRVRGKSHKMEEVGLSELIINYY